MFFDPRLNIEISGKRVAFTDSTEAVTPAIISESYIKNTVKSKLKAEGEVLCRRLTFAVGIPDEVKAEIEKHTAVSGNAEEYAVILGEESYVYATEERGLIYGLATLTQLIDAGENSERLIYDYPVCSVRGYRVYMSGRENIGLFKDMIDLLVYYKYNTLVLEIGGAMEYKKHPEINEEWVKFCTHLSEYSGKGSDIQRKYHYMKNSVHIENGDGSFLTQDECRDIAAYCRERGIEIIPECPTLSHADYLLLPHPEFCERENDEIPDTYCPNHPDVYKYVFEVLDEVIDVFQPKRMDIGHDEFYSMCVCERCKDKDPVDLFIKDIETLRDYLASKGVEILVCGEKMVKAVSASGKRYGGWYDKITYPNGDTFRVPDFYHCVDKCPKDVTWLNWYWIFGEEIDKVYRDHGYKTLYLNFSVIGCENFRERLSWGVSGGFVSNWGSNEDEYMQRNCQNFSLISTAYAFWCDGYDSDKEQWLIDHTMLEDYRRHYHGKQNLMTVLHTTDHSIPYREFWCGRFIEDEKYLLGHYKLTYKDGDSVLLPVKYGTNITSMTVGGDSDSDPADRCGSSAFMEVSGSTLPKLQDGKFWYECMYENPCPEKEFESIEYIPAAGMENINVYRKVFSYKAKGDR